MQPHAGMQNWVTPIMHYSASEDYLTAHGWQQVQNSELYQYLVA
jgi:hypothetical protein